MPPAAVSPLTPSVVPLCGQLFHRTYCGDSSKFALRLQCRDASSAAGGGHVGFHRQRGCHRIIERIDSLLFHSEGYLGLTQLLEISFECQSLSCTVLQDGVGILGEKLEVVSKVSPAFTWLLPPGLEFALVMSFPYLGHKHTLERCFYSIKHTPRCFQK